VLLAPGDRNLEKAERKEHGVAASEKLLTYDNDHEHKDKDEHDDNNKDKDKDEDENKDDDKNEDEDEDDCRGTISFNNQHGADEEEDDYGNHRRPRVRCLDLFWLIDDGNCMTFKLI
jgi:hypothetical protein